MDSMPSSPRGEDDLQDISAEVGADALKPVEVFAPEKEVNVESDAGLAANDAGLAANDAGLAANDAGLAANDAADQEVESEELNQDPLDTDDSGSEVVSAQDSDEELDAPIEQHEVLDLESNDFTSLYRETILSMFVKSLRESGLIGQSVRVLLACKSKYVNITIARDIFGWSQTIKYKSEQYKTFVPAINVETINMLPAEANQSVMDVRPIFDGVKNKTNSDTTTFMQDQINAKVIMSSSVPYSNQFMEGTPMIDLVLQNPGSIYIVTENGNMDTAFDFLRCNIMKTSKKKKMVQGMKTIVKTFNLRDILYILSEAGANDVTVINATNGFTFEDDPVDEDDVLEEGKNVNEEDSIFDEPDSEEEEPAANMPESEEFDLDESENADTPEAVEQTKTQLGAVEQNKTQGEVGAVEQNKTQGEVGAVEQNKTQWEVGAGEQNKTPSDGTNPGGGKKTRKHKIHRQKQTRKNPTPL